MNKEIIEEEHCPYCESDDIFHISITRAICCDCLKEFDKEIKENGIQK